MEKIGFVNMKMEFSKSIFNGKQTKCKSLFKPNIFRTFLDWFVFYTKPSLDWFILKTKPSLDWFVLYTKVSLDSFVLYTKVSLDWFILKTKP